MRGALYRLPRPAARKGSPFSARQSGKQENCVETEHHGERVKYQFLTLLSKFGVETRTEVARRAAGRRPSSRFFAPLSAAVKSLPQPGPGGNIKVGQERPRMVRIKR